MAKRIPNPSRRRAVSDELKWIFKGERGGVYSYLHRGPVNWGTFNFEKHKRAVAIMFDDGRLFADRKGIRSATLTLEVFARLPDVHEELDDTLMDELYEDVLSVLQKLLASVDDDGNAILLRIHYGSDNAIETHDATRGVQGLIATVRIDF